MRRPALVLLTIATGLLVTVATAPRAGAQARGTGGPRVWAVVIGIDRYADPAIPPSPGAREDARALHQWLTRTAGWPSDNVLLMVPDASAATEVPRRRNLDRALRDWLGARVQKDDIVLISFAGQAVGLPPTAKLPRRQYLLPLDADSRDFDGTGWRIEEALSDLAARARNPIVVWLDTSPRGRDKAVLPESPYTPSGTRWLDALGRWPNVAAWLAADQGLATSGKGLSPHSPFTTALLKHLGTSKAPSNLAGCLARLNGEPALTSQGFRTIGGVSPDLTLWRRDLARLALPPLELLLQQGHGNRVVGLAITPDGRTAISGAMDATVKVWRLDDRALLRSLPYHTIGVTGLALSPDGRRAVSADLNGALWLWDLATLRATTYRGAQKPHERGITKVEFLPDNVHFASIDQGGRVVLWTVAGDDLKAATLTEEATALACGPGRVVVAGSDAQGAAWIRLFSAEGTPARDKVAPAALVPPANLALSGDRLAFADKTGRLTVRDLAADKELVSRPFEGGVDGLSFNAAGLAVGSSGMLHLLTLDPSRPTRTFSIGGPLLQVTASADGCRIATLNDEGRIHAWRLAHGKEPEPIALAQEGETGRATSLAFAPDGRALVAGGQEGAIRTWNVENGEARPEIPAHRSQVAGLSVSRDGRYLLQITTFDGKAVVWDLEQGRHLQTIPGAWSSGIFLPEEPAIALTSRKGEVVLVDRSNGQTRPIQYPRPPAREGGGASNWDFGLIAASPDGKLLAAASPNGPLARIWEKASGKPLRTIRVADGVEGFTSISFAGDGRHVVTTSDAPDGQARVWAVDAPDDADPAWACKLDDGAVTIARFHPGNDRQLVTGHRDGRVVLWALGDNGATRPTPIKRAGEPIHALTFTPDGSRFAAAGGDKSVWIWPTAEAPRGGLRYAQAHAEQINALVVWPDGGRLASGGDDGQIKLWDLADGRLLGTLVANPETTGWIVYTAEGRFDSSPGAEQQVTFLAGRDVLPLAQFQDRCHHFRLANELRLGRRPPLVSAFRAGDAPPALAIDRPLPATLNRDLELTIALGDGPFENLRLYHNDIPVKSAEVWPPSSSDDLDFDHSDPSRPVARVRLRKGMNRFYVMAGRPDGRSFDGKSDDVTVRFDGEDTPGRLHVLALGVSKYQKRALRYADSDAKTIVSFLGANGADLHPKDSRLVPLTNEEVTKERVHAELTELRRVAKPEDTVVVFLAGHTDVLQDLRKQDLFCLFLPKFPFRDDVPDLAVALRGPGGDGGAGLLQNPEAVLPYAEIYKIIARLPAQRRLVVIDACRAGAALEDPLVRKLQERAAEKIDDAAHRIRTDYILAARANESAVEVKELKHGLLTHVLLNGMGANLPLKAEPVRPHADFDADGVVSTEELRRYVDGQLPILAARYAREVPRAGGESTPNGEPSPPPRLQSSESRPFALSRVPK